jgi:hypothetical protein
MQCRSQIHPERTKNMSKLEKRLIISAILFVLVYMGAIVITVQSRLEAKDKETRIESTLPTEEEGRLLLAELLPPMAVLFTLSVCFLVAKKKRAKTYNKLDDSDGKEGDGNQPHGDS